MGTSELINFVLIEDDDDHAAIVLRTLERNRVVNNVKRLIDGADALAYLREEPPYAGRPMPDVILLDLKLPKVDGHEVLKKIKEDPGLKHIPVVILTTSNAEADRAKAYAHHANSYLVKPVNFQRFRQMVSDLSLYWGVWNKPAPQRGPQPELLGQDSHA
ncbi:MAG: response regulator [Candidatus Hydrogenedentes bacterium]|nr:response regulator [Candidatus Hydrogenedentota bacterium]